MNATLFQKIKFVPKVGGHKYCLILTEVLNTDTKLITEYYYYFDNDIIYYDFNFNPHFDIKEKFDLWRCFIKENAQKVTKQFINF